MITMTKKEFIKQVKELKRPVLRRMSKYNTIVTTELEGKIGRVNLPLDLFNKSTCSSDSSEDMPDDLKDDPLVYLDTLVQLEEYPISRSIDMHPFHIYRSTEVAFIFNFCESAYGLVRETIDNKQFMSFELHIIGSYHK